MHYKMKPDAQELNRSYCKNSEVRLRLPVSKSSRLTPKNQKTWLDQVFKAKFEDFSIHYRMERDTGIEPVFFAWEANVLPLN